MHPRPCHWYVFAGSTHINPCLQSVTLYPKLLKCSSYSKVLSAFISSLTNSGFSKHRSHAAFVILLLSVTLHTYLPNIFSSNLYWQKIEISSSTLEALENEHRPSRHSASSNKYSETFLRSYHFCKSSDYPCQVCRDQTWIPNTREDQMWLLTIHSASMQNSRLGFRSSCTTESAIRWVPKKAVPRFTHILATSAGAPAHILHTMNDHRVLQFRRKRETINERGKTVGKQQIKHFGKMIRAVIAEKCWTLCKINLHSQFLSLTWPSINSSWTWHSQQMHFVFRT